MRYNADANPCWVHNNLAVVMDTLVTLCGHSEISQPDAVKDWLNIVTRDLLSSGADIFYFGGYGAFDRLAASVIHEVKAGQNNVKAVLVLPYLNSNIDATGYDYTVYPPLESVPLRYAISKRNQWMVEQADMIVAYVTHSWGGAAKTLEYARRKKKQIILFPEARPKDL